ncbi:MAG: hypothetical protein FD165_560 [Gammaproteobacteria bacterium]|nr:MAG: hypothetical protein FD165_560 [Gammaproteobacteria bacterium]TND02178.1 MAG: hypothetical protein FD120_2342 [Gammaproteobacteria bacterium]
MAIECVETQEWIEEEISKPVEEWVEKTEEKCKKRKWYDPRRWLCWLVTTFVKVVRWVVVKVGKWVVRTVCKIVGAVLGFVRDFFTGLWDVIAGIFTLDWRRILDGLITIGSGFIDLVATLARIQYLGDTLDYIIEEYNRGQLRDYVRKLLEKKYSGEELDNIKKTLRVDHGAFGYRIPMRAIRTFLDSETPSPREPGVSNLVVLHEQGEINLRELCGFDFTEGFWNRKRYKTLKKGLHAGGGGFGEIDNPISEDELDTYLSSRGAQGPKFIVLCMRDGVLKTKLRAAELKGRELGLMPQWTQETKEVKLPEHIKHKGFDTGVAATSLVNFLVDPIGRQRKVRDANGNLIDETAALGDLCTPVAVGVFRYTDTLRGIAACLKGSSCQHLHDASGVTFIDNKPDIVWKYVPIHELGHYFGLCHVDGVDRIMYSSRQNSWFDWWTLPKLLYTKGEPSFTLGEAKQTWDYIVAHFPARCLGGNDAGPVIL